MTPVAVLSPEQLEDLVERAVAKALARAPAERRPITVREAAPPPPRRAPSYAAKTVAVAKARRRCEACGFQPRQGIARNILHVHHILPRSKGGSHDPANLITICPNCHATAHALWRARRKEAWDGPVTREGFLSELAILSSGVVTPADCPPAMRGELLS